MAEHRAAIAGGLSMVHRTESAPEKKNFVTLRRGLRRTG